jgi:hypothetical protein
MSEEMVMRTSDSPAEAPDTRGFSQLLVDSTSYANEDNGAPALNSTEETGDVQDFSWLDDLVDTTPDPQDAVRQRLAETLSAQHTPENVPYDRFREVNEQAKAAKEQASNYEKWAEIITALEADGYKSGQDLKDAWARQQEAANETQIRQKYVEMAQANIMSNDAAQVSADLEIQRMKYDQLVSQVEAANRVQKMDQAYKDFPYARRGERIVNNLVQRGMDPLEAASYVHEEISNMAESLVPELASLFEAQQRAPIPIDTSQSAQPLVQDTTPTRGASGIFSRLMGISKNSFGV